MQTLKIKIILLFILLYFAGCSDNLTGSGNNSTDATGKVSNEFLFTQEYGYCDTICQAINVIIGSYSLPYAQVSYVREINTGDTVYSGLPKTGFKFMYDTQNEIELDYGNGVVKSYNGVGIDSMKYFCNTNYQIIITYK